MSSSSEDKAETSDMPTILREPDNQDVIGNDATVAQRPSEANEAVANPCESVKSVFAKPETLAAVQYYLQRVHALSLIIWVVVLTLDYAKKGDTRTLLIGAGQYALQILIYNYVYKDTPLLGSRRHLGLQSLSALERGEAEPSLSAKGDEEK